MSVNEKMTAIADAIRAKAGVTETMGLDRMKELIAGIQTGMQEFHGTLTVAEDGIKSIPVENQLGVIPKVIIFSWLGTAEAKEISANRSKLSFMLVMEAAADVTVRSPNYGVMGYGTSNGFGLYWHTYGDAYYANAFCKATEDTIQFGTSSMNVAYAFDVGDEYFYMAIC